MDDLVRQTAEYIAQHRLAKLNHRVLVAVSGGVDSVVLLDILSRLGYELGVAHANFGLREEADDDQEFVKQLAAQYGAPFYSKKFRTKTENQKTDESLQMTARRLRYAWFATLQELHRFDRLATAHQQDDQAETLLLELFRGRGFPLYRGIPTQRGTVIRPLLHSPKARLVAYAEENGLHWREDATNATTDYLRNHLRHDTFPSLVRLHSNPSRQLVRKLEHYRQQFAALEDYFDQLHDTCVRESADGPVVDLTALSTHPVSTVRSFLNHYFNVRLGLNAEQTAQAVRLKDQQVGRRLELPNLEIIRERNELVVVRPQKNAAPFVADKQRESARELQFHVRDLPVTLSLNGTEVRINRQRIRPGAMPPRGLDWLSLEKVQFPVTLRTWRPGDKLQPLNGPGTQKVSDLLTNAKVPTAVRPFSLVLVDAAGVVAVQYARIADRVKLDKSATEVLVVEFRAPKKD